MCLEDDKIWQNRSREENGSDGIRILDGIDNGGSHTADPSRRREVMVMNGVVPVE